MAERGIRQGEVALELGIDRSELCRILAGIRRAPDGFDARFREAVNAAGAKKAARLCGTPAGAAQ